MSSNNRNYKSHKIKSHISRCLLFFRLFPLPCMYKKAEGEDGTNLAGEKKSLKG